MREFFSTRIYRHGCKSQLTGMSFMFKESYLNQSIDAWNISSVRLMNEMFARSNPFSHSLLSWDVSAVTDMNGIFFQSVYDGDILTWGVSNVVDMENAFSDTDFFNQDISSWNVSNAQTSGRCFPIHHVLM
mmetsp:Transcript_29585/g.39358  ORF Transcript_29585/g.39358 Transcript_29585/m.39358 type:complete len:131 (-) Transcript_29585:171-563(-)